jgi:hypothetical protein
MRYMILVKASTDCEAEAMPTEDLLAAMADYHEQLAKVGVLLDGNGLQPSSKGWRLLPASHLNWKRVSTRRLG